MSRTKTTSKTVEYRAAQPYWTKRDISILFEMSQLPAEKLYKIASKVDDDELGDFRIYDTRVRAKTVLNIVGIDHDQLPALQ